MVQQSEKPEGQIVSMRPARPGEEQSEQTLKLLQVYAVLLQIRQAGVVTAHRVTAAAPVTAGQMLGLMGTQMSTWSGCFEFM